MKRIALCLGLATFLAPGRAELGQIHYEPVGLDEVLAATPTIVVVRPTATRDSKAVDLGEGIEPFGYADSRYEVVEYLRPPRPAREGETLVVSGFDEGQFSLHVAYHAMGMHRSPIWAMYTSEHPPAAGDDLILFLRRGTFLRYDPATKTLSGAGDTYIPSVGNAVEGIGAKPTLAPRAKEPCGCVDSVNITVGAPGVTDAMRETIGEAISARFADESALGWQVVDTRPARGPR